MSQEQNNFDMNNFEDFEDMNDNYEESEENHFYEGGAHFKYQELFNKLKEIKQNNNIKQSKNNNYLNNINRIPPKSRNIQLNN